jgi:tetratricopeptide (TPR) repeat protein
MAAVSKFDSKGKTDDLNFGEKLNEFFQKNRKGLIISLAAVVVLLIGFAVGFAVYGNLQEKALSTVEEFNRQYEALRVYINSENEEDASKKDDVKVLQEDLAVFEAKASGFTAARAYAISAGIYGDQKNWADAEKNWANAAAAAAKTYFEPVALFNAAISAEEQGNNDDAIGFYNQVLGFSGDDFSAAPRAQFAIGRIEEDRGNKEAAIEAYRAVLSKWSGDEVWANLAQSRIIVLQKQ